MIPNTANRPFASLIENYILFRLQMVGYQCRGRKVRLTARMKEDDNDLHIHQTDLFIGEVEGQEPINLSGFVRIEENDTRTECTIRIMKDSFGPRNPPREYEQFVIDDTVVSRYLDKFYNFVTSDEWEE